MRPCGTSTRIHSCRRFEVLSLFMTSIPSAELKAVGRALPLRFHDVEPGSGCFLLSFPETWQAASFAISLDLTSDMLKPFGADQKAASEARSRRCAGSLRQL